MVDDSIVRGTQLRETTEFLYRWCERSTYPSCVSAFTFIGCKYLNFSRSKSEMDLITRRVIQEKEGDDAQKYLSEYADPNQSALCRPCWKRSARQTLLHSAITDWMI